MRNPQLGRLVLAHIDTNPGLFTMGTWAVRIGDDIHACIAGRTLLLSGYTYQHGRFLRPDGTPVDNPADEAALVLGLTDSERHGPDGRTYLFFNGDNDAALARFRRIVETPETAT